MGDSRLLTAKCVYPGRVLRLQLERVELPNGVTAELEVVRHGGAAAVVPIDEDGAVLLVRQYRHATGGWLVEVPAGKLDPDETPEACALRETEEEIGYRAGRLESLGWVWTTPGFSDEKIWLFQATELTRTRARLEDDEVLEVERVPFEDAVAMAVDGRLRDGKSIAALLRAWHVRRRPDDAAGPPT